MKNKGNKSKQFSLEQKKNVKSEYLTKEEFKKRNKKAMEKAEGEYRKYQVKTLSSVEKAYIETLKELKQIENKTKEKK